MALDKSGWVKKRLLIEALPQTLEEEALNVAADYESQVERRLGKTAAPRDNRKFVWSTNSVKNKKAQRWWFANIRKGNIPTDGKHYRRQGKPPYGWRVDIDIAGDSFQIIISNQWSKSWTVFGNIGQGGQKAQVVGHGQTGWITAEPEINRIGNEILQDLVDRIFARMGRI